MGGVVDAVFGKNRPPKPPDPIKTAEAQGTANLEAARTTAALNRANQETPFGRLTWEQDPTNPDMWTSRVSLDPQIQRLLNAQLSTSGNLQGAIDNSLQYLNEMLANPLKAPDYNSLYPMPQFNEAGRKQAENALYAQATARLDPKFAQDRNRFNTSLITQGITQGSRAYDQALENFAFAENDAYANARNEAIARSTSDAERVFNRELAARGQSLQEAQMAYQNQVASRNQILNELNALRSGAQTMMPSFGDTNSGAQVLAAPFAQAMYNNYQGQLAGYGAKTDSQNAMMQGLASILGGSKWVTGA